MAKETLYFSHDFGARNDPKLINLQIKHGMLGIGCYWCIVEMLHEEGGEIPLEYERIAFSLRTDTNVINSIINDFDLFITQDKMLSSNSVLRRIDLRNQKSIKARESISNRWNKYKNNTNVKNNYTNVSKNDTIKERKVKERKGNKIKEDEISPSKLIYERSEEIKLQSELIKSDVWQEDVCRELLNKKEISIMPQTLKGIIPNFIIHLASKGKYPISLKEARNYFSNWIPFNLPTDDSEKKLSFDFFK